jgi:hypothetical protein
MIFVDDIGQRGIRVDRPEVCGGGSTRGTREPGSPGLYRVERPGPVLYIAETQQ